ncbi:MAG TPA: hypothetical protein VK674_07140 [Candidatus Limnocylindria bacterium]|nr:hypothetical protein [Candidatus Limnocylindria bacterium]
MGTVKKLEDKLEAFFKGAPPLPDSSREALAGVWPWIALVFGMLQLFGAWALWNLVRAAESVFEYGSFYVNYPAAVSSSDKSIIYVGIGVLVADAVILLMAYPELKKRSRRGWHLLFLGALINAAYSVLSLFIHGRGAGTFVFSLIGSAVGFYLLFQVRGKYGSVKSSRTSRGKKT